MFFLTIISLFICINVAETALNLSEVEMLDKSIPKERTIKIRGNVTYIKRSGDSNVSHQSLPIFWPQTGLQSLPFDHDRSVVNHRFTNIPSSPFYPVEPAAQNGGPPSMFNAAYPIGPPPQPMPPAYATFPQPPSTGPTTSCECCCCPSAASRNCPCLQNCHPPCCGVTQTTTPTPTTTTAKTTTEKTTTIDPRETTTTTTEKTPTTIPTTLSSTTTNPHRNPPSCCPPMIINCPNNRAPCFMNGGGCSTGPCIFPPFIDGTGGYPVGLPTYPGGYPAVPSFPGVPMPNYAPGGGHYPTVPESPGIYPIMVKLQRQKKMKYLKQTFDVTAPHRTLVSLRK
uniref:Uncharacterized protein n=1 Tax=Globodera rostochiensis TaxID=31243 RepID=A0A914H6W2_GLORO